MFFIILYIIILICLITLAVAGCSFAPWVPMWSKDLDRVIKLSELKQGEVFYDLGCGNGKSVFYAAKNAQAKAKGIEIGLPLYLYCQFKKILTSAKNTNFKLGDLFKEDLSQADVIYFFGMPKNIQAKLKAKLEKELKPGARVVSYAFPVEGWQAALHDKPKEKDISIYLYKR